MKQIYHKTNVYTYEQLVEVCDFNQHVNAIKVVEGDFKDWDKYLDKFYTGFVMGTVTPAHVFEVESLNPTKMMIRDAITEPYTAQNFRKNTKTPETDEDCRARVEAMKAASVPVIPFPGIKEIKQVELYSKWRKFLPEEFRDVTCPKPDEDLNQSVFLLAILQSMQYHVRTIHGMSANFFSNLDGWVLGTLQGSGASPAIWLAVFIAIANAFIQEFPGPFGSDPRNLIQLNKSVEAFVDDADLWHVLSGSNDFASARVTIQKMAQKWERLLFVSWWSLSWKWVDGIPFFKSINESPGTVAITSGTSPTTTVITRLEPDKGVAALGPIFTPSGNTETQYNLLIEQATILGKRITAAPLNRLEAQIMLEQFVQPNIGYPLAAACLTIAQCKKLDSLILPSIISKMGYNRHTSRTVLYGPVHLGAIGIMNFWLIQGLSHVDYLVGHLRLQDLVGNFLQTLIDYYYLSFGFQDPLFSYDITHLKTLRPEYSWVCTTWDFLLTASMHPL
jgi:hypothetical protein